MATLSNLTKLKYVIDSMLLLITLKYSLIEKETIVENKPSIEKKTRFDLYKANFKTLQLKSL